MKGAGSMEMVIWEQEAADNCKMEQGARGQIKMEQGARRDKREQWKLLKQSRTQKRRELGALGKMLKGDPYQSLVTFNKIHS